jgi:hypothetical protein
MRSSVFVLLALSLHCDLIADAPVIVSLPVNQGE